MPRRFLTDDDVMVLQRLLDNTRGTSINTPVRRPKKVSDVSPDTYLAKAQTDISARDDTVSPPIAGSETCNIYRVNDDGEIVHLVGTEKTVYNFRTEDISSESYFAVGRTKSGQWVALS